MDDMDFRIVFLETFGCGKTLWSIRKLRLVKLVVYINASKDSELCKRDRLFINYISPQFSN